MTTRANATIEDLYNLPDKGKAEIVDGELVLMSPAGEMPNRAGGSIYISLRQHEGRTTGRAYTDNALMIIHERVLVQPSPCELVHPQRRLRRVGSKLAKQLTDLVCSAQRAVHLGDAHGVSDFEVHI